MSTRNIVPRADGEGGLGTAAKKWGAVHASAFYYSILTRTKLFTQNITIPSDSVGVSYGPVILENDKRVIVEHNAMWRIF